MEDINQELALSSRNQTPVMVTFPLLIDSIGLGDPDFIHVQMELIGSVSPIVALAEPSSVVVIVLDDSELVVT